MQKLSPYQTEIIAMTLMHGNPDAAERLARSGTADLSYSSCVEIPDSAEFFGTGKTVRVDATVDDVRLENVGAMVTGTGGHMVSLNAKVRTALGKDIGDVVQVAIAKR
jgi:hypothetical protein